MKIQCRCGAMIFDATDGLPNKAHIIPDREWNGLLDAIDAAIEKSGPSADEKEASCMRIRTLLTKRSRDAWQCARCRRIYIEDRERELREFVPAADGSADLFESGNR